MTTTPRLRLGLNFALSLLLSWTLVTALLALAAWADRHAPQRQATWVALWIFTVVVPTVQALRVHRRLGEVLRNYPTIPPQVRHDLEHARFVIVACGSMVVLLVLMLRFGLSSRSSWPMSMSHRSNHETNVFDSLDSSRPQLWPTR